MEGNEMTTTNDYIVEAFGAFVQALRDGYGARGAAAVRAALDGNYDGATELEAEHEALMNRIAAITESYANPGDRVMANDLGGTIVTIITPEMMALNMVLDCQLRDASEMLDKGREVLAQFT